MLSKEYLSFSTMKKSNNNPKKKNGFSEFIINFLKQYENKIDFIIQINQLSIDSGVEKRRLYDLLNVLVACGICIKAGPHAYQWKGLSTLSNLLPSISRDIEIKALTEDLDKLFYLPESPAIGTLAINFLGIFVYFGTQSLNIRDIAVFLSPDEEKSKPILRRLYLVAFLLERIGILKHSTKVGECLINADLKELTKSTLTALSVEGRFPPDCIKYQLNRFDDLYVTRLQAERKSQLISQLQSKINQANIQKQSQEIQKVQQIPPIVLFQLRT
ncbi:hypothetical protein GPJ56_004722 [Histomonas meleagridis]|uniref:uncharacterized protein n=1 Tax=Histomonas meleagridis TaxID=135588 RepID=UPI00355A2BDC|nr:hypothetical protein GPJ56_004722 [Histomonas meleagridis]KAH0799535.1 hypothetical protein GO595_007603 [Histomonas meleagridis]